MTTEELKSKLEYFRSLPAETEWLEFKEAKNNYDFTKFGRYFSALSNEANLKRQANGWLVFGVENKSHDIVGTSYRTQRKDLDSLKKEIADQTNSGITLTEIHELDTEKGRVIMFQIPPAPQGIPTSWQGHFYGRHNESLEALSIQELEQIRNQGIQEDWSSEIISKAGISDLDTDALLFARKKFKEKNSEEPYASDIDSWDDSTFLNRAKLAINGNITRAALILLGKPESSHFISPAVAEITWKLDYRDEKDYKHFGPPFLLNTDKVFKKVRNTKCKIQPFNHLVLVEVIKYDLLIVLEALHNCIAHQDYTKNARIILTEYSDRLELQNAGGFFEGSIDDYVFQEKTPERYRNKFLADAMVNLGMIDTMGYGILTMFRRQRKRYFPLPEYDLTIPDRVTVEIMGQVIDENYSKMLIEEADLPLSVVISMDKLQKAKPLHKHEIQELRKRNLVEGRVNRLHIAAHIAAITGEKVKYTKNKAFDKQYYKDLVLKYLEQFGRASRKDLFNLLVDKLPDALNEKQKKNRVKNLLYEMSHKDKSIKTEGSTNGARWGLAND